MYLHYFFTECHNLIRVNFGAVKNSLIFYFEGGWVISSKKLDLVSTLKRSKTINSK